MCSTGGCAAKYDPNLLGMLISAASTQAQPDVLVGLSAPDDAAVVGLGAASGMVFSVDFFPPVVDDPHVYGRIAANNALGDIFAMGGRPRFALAIAGMPDGLPGEVARDIVEGARWQCEADAAVLVGGHTIASAEPFFGLAVVGFVDPHRIWRKSGACPGDALVLTKRLGSGLAVTANRRGVIDEGMFSRVIECMCESNAAAADIIREFNPGAVTDVTGFGLLGHAAEMAKASGVGLAIDLAAMPVLDGVLTLASSGVRTSAHDRNREFIAHHTTMTDPADEDLLAIALDPQTAGGLLIAIADDRADEMLRVLGAAGVAAVKVGSVRDGAGLTVS